MTFTRLINLITDFKALGINKDLCKAIEELGFKKPTEVQKESIPFLLTESKNLISLAQTGTGKTAAFGLPLIQKTEIKNIISSNHQKKKKKYRFR